MKIYLYIAMLLLSCIACQNKKESIIEKEFKINFWKETTFAEYYFFENFKENENSIRYLFNSAKKMNGFFIIVTNKNSFSFEDGIEFINEKNQYQIFYFDKISDKKDGVKDVKINFLENIKINFLEKQRKNKIELSSDFVELNLNTLQNFLDYAEKDDNKKKHKAYTYELYNKDKIKKAALTYHNYGEWFSVDIL